MNRIEFQIYGFPEDVIGKAEKFDFDTLRVETFNENIEQFETPLTSENAADIIAMIVR